ncbi:MAG TPA: hypothetical protein VHG51_17790 [Longimicrobiaceae bacterium]|nr:hypothetical protein [Longimicrobiaceae bacterium]
MPVARAAAVLLPAVLLDTAFTLDLVGRLSGAAWLWTAGAHLAVAGVALGVLAGLPAGAVGARERGGRPGRLALLYGAGLALFALARWVRGDAAVPPEAVLVAAEGIADAMMLAGASAGGFLDRWLRP